MEETSYAQYLDIMLDGELSNIDNRVITRFCSERKIKKRKKNKAAISEYRKTNDFQSEMDREKAKSIKYQMLLQEKTDYQATQNMAMEAEYNVFLKTEEEKEQKRQKAREEEQRRREEREAHDRFMNDVRDKYDEGYVSQLLTKYADMLFDYSRDLIREGFSDIRNLFDIDPWDAQTYGITFRPYNQPRTYSHYWENFPDTPSSNDLIGLHDYFKQEGTGGFVRDMLSTDFPLDDLLNAAICILSKNEPEIADLLDTDACDIIIEATAEAIEGNNEFAVDLFAQLEDEFSTERLFDMLRENTEYTALMSDYDKKVLWQEHAKQALLERIPERAIDLYPAARLMKRRFVLHIGPTNSGKTYDAIQALQNAGRGIYLAPLRLLAFEQYEAFLAAGLPCSLVTGEERTGESNALFQSSTIEMLNFTVHYPCAVIDEAQMAADPVRGGAWTAAILGVLADEIHVCAAPHAEQVLIRLIEECGDDYEIVEHNRNTPLAMESKQFNFPSSVGKGDALIVFSRKNVHAVASELQRNGFSCSILYGNLPYDVRQDQAKKFRDGETDVVVSTDCIGMGLNMPIRRIVFLEQDKFDGARTRPLTKNEVQQIAGRAGRQGIFSEGLVNTYGQKKAIRKKLSEHVPEIHTVMLDMPQSAIGAPGPLSTILEQWGEMEAPTEIYQKANTEEMRELCRVLEQYSDNKPLIYEDQESTTSIIPAWAWVNPLLVLNIRFYRRNAVF